MNKPKTIDETLSLLSNYKSNASIERLSPKEAKAALSAMVAEIIGEDQREYKADGSLLMSRYNTPITKGKNKLKAEQRQRAIKKGFML